VVDLEETIRPKIYCSRCLEFAHCRYDGSVIGSSIVKELMQHSEFIHDCPEMGIGLGVPRPPVKVYEDDQGYHLYQTSTDRDHTDNMVGFVDDLLQSMGEVDGIILKAKSPSCGIGDVKIYPTKEKGRIKRMGSGFLGMEVEKRFSHIAVETEKRLMDERIRDHFLTKLYTNARFRNVRKSGKPKDLIRFHSRAKYLLMSYNQTVMREMGRIVSDQKAIGIGEAFDRYGKLLGEAMARGPRFTSHINVCMHGFGYVSSELTDQEKDLFMQSLDLFRDDRIPLNSLKTMLLSWFLRYKVDYMLDQFYFQPYPIELIQAFDGKRDRELWK
jgi:uncharacterized protein YbgA (DUF1722 family)/uncharacterized protein YbbK (DUF523 family)